MQLAGVAHLVVVPGYDTYLINLRAASLCQCLRGIEQGAIGHTDDIAGYDLLLSIAEGFIGSCLHSGIDALYGYALGIILQGSIQNGNGTGSYRNTLRGTDQLTCQLRDYKTDGAWLRRCCWEQC